VYTGAVGIALADMRWSVVAQAQGEGQNEAWVCAATTRAASLADRGAYTESEALWREIVRVDREALGDEHPDTLRSMAGLARALGVQQKHTEAEHIDRELLRAHTEALGPDHPTTRKAACQLKRDVWRALADKAKGAVLTRPNKALRAECERLAVEILEETTQIYGEDHEATLTAAGDVAAVIQSGCVARVSTAVPIFRRVLAAQTRAFGEGHRATFTTSANLAAALARLSQFDEAESIMVRTVEASKRALGHGHQDTAVYVQWLVNVRLDRLTIAHNDAVGMLKCGNAAQAVPIFQHVLAEKTRLLGAEHPTLFATSASLASALGDLGKFKEAKRILVRAVDASTRALGPKDPTTVTCAQYLLDLRAQRRRGREDAQATLTAAKRRGR
jgi:tetratricopeptide (TPR) repeat protein